jgi:hypothetical protein
MPNEVQEFVLGCDFAELEAGLFQLEIGGFFTDNIDWNDDEAAILSAFEIGLGSGEADVTKDTDRVIAEFIGSRANTNIAQGTVSSNTLRFNSASVTVTVDQSGVQPESEAREITTGGATGGDYGLNYNGTGPFTVAVTGNDATDLAALQAVLDANISTEIIAAGSGGIFQLEFTGSLANQDFDDSIMTISDDNTTGGTGVSISVYRQGTAGLPTIITITLDGVATEQWLIVDTGASQQTAAIATNADAATVEAAIEAALTSGSFATCSVSGSAGGPWTVTSGTNNFPPTWVGGRVVSITPNTIQEGGSGGGGGSAGAALLLLGVGG